MPFKKGDPNINRKGRPPRGETFRDAIEKEALVLVKSGSLEISKQEAIVKILFKKASEGDLKAIEMIMDRTDGKPKVSLDHTTKGESIKSISPHTFVGDDEN